MTRSVISETCCGWGRRANGCRPSSEPRPWAVRASTRSGTRSRGTEPTGRARVSWIGGGASAYWPRSRAWWHIDWASGPRRCSWATARARGGWPPISPNAVWIRTAPLTYFLVMLPPGARPRHPWETPMPESDLERWEDHYRQAGERDADF